MQGPQYMQKAFRCLSKGFLHAIYFHPESLMRPALFAIGATGFTFWRGIG
jgi:hypothetical protein